MWRIRGSMFSWWLLAGNVPDKRVVEALTKNHFDWGARIGAAQGRGEGILSSSHFRDASGITVSSDRMAGGDASVSAERNSTAWFEFLEVPRRWRVRSRQPNLHHEWTRARRLRT
jgi:hypothetical protein